MPSQLSKIIHSLRFQLPAVVLFVVLGILFLLLLFFHEMNIILVKTGELGNSAEVNDLVVKWNGTLQMSARERTKLMSLGNPTYLRNFRVTLNEIEEIFSRIQTVNSDSALKSTKTLVELHEIQMEYLQKLNVFADVQARAKKSVPILLASKKKSINKILKMRKAPSFKLELETPKLINLDSLTNEKFKNYEQALREGLLHSQDLLRAERKEKLQNLRNAVYRSKNRLIYSLLLLLLMVGYVAVILKWKIMDPMKRLKAGVEEIGHGNLGHLIDVRSQNEIGELAEVFNRMSTQLEEKRNAEVRLKRLEAIEQIVRSVNHEINNPLMIISGNAEYLLALLEKSPNRFEIDPGMSVKLHSIIAESHRIFTVTQQLKEIKETITENYLDDRDKMIDLSRSSQVYKRDY